MAARGGGRHWDNMLGTRFSCDLQREENNTSVRGDLLYLINADLPKKRYIYIRKSSNNLITKNDLKHAYHKRTVRMKHSRVYKY